MPVLMIDGTARSYRGPHGYGLVSRSGSRQGALGVFHRLRGRRYEDGLKVTVGPPRREADGTYGLTVTYENGA
ncbi:hypothetical protein GCM10010293_67510 [Streptomyces griseoflavus]|nr:hypothetical protein GCM10010293_67510 [Streptomyces griseoflavus]